MWKYLLALVVTLIFGASSYAQDQATASALIGQGFEVKAAYSVASYSQNAVLYLQKEAVVYVCAITTAPGGLVRGGDVARAACSRV